MEATMSKIEKEVKILNIPLNDIENKMKNNSSFIFNSFCFQRIYVYDLPSFYSRFIDIIEIINSSIVDKSIAVSKFKTLYLEIVDLTDYLNFIKNIDDINLELIKKIIYDKKFIEVLKTLKVNPNKWIRLREYNGVCELTVKHILEKERTAIQNVVETEVIVSSFSETNLILESLGFSHRGYQEKKRYKYQYKDAEVDIDIWPKLQPYLEIEYESENILNEILLELGYSRNDIVSVNTETLYKKIGIDIKSVKELKFD